MKKKVIEFINRHHLIEPNKTILVGVSGGPDSMALLHFLKSIQESYQLNLIALCIDHQLRGEQSKEELEFVKSVCNKWEVPFISESIDVVAYKKKHQVSTQMAARDLRYECYKKHMKNQSAHYLALGHHADDQIETMFMALSQVTDPSALSGIPVKRPFSAGVIIRPLLAVTKDEINDYCHTYEINPKMDPSNLDDHYMRIYYRQQIIPKIKERNRNIGTTIQYLSNALSDDESYLMNEAVNVFESDKIKKRTNQKVKFLINEFNEYPISLQRRIYRLILDYLYDELPKNLSYVHEESFLTLVQGDKSNVRIDFPKRLKVEKSYNELAFYFESEQKQSNFHKVIDHSTIVNLPDGATLSFSYTDEQIYDENEYIYSCSVNDLAFPLHIRTRRPGDRMSWQGLNGSRKIKDLFIDEKIPRSDRDKKWLITDNDGVVLWIIGVKKGLPQKRNEQQEHPSYINITYHKN